MVEYDSDFFSYGWLQSGCVSDEAIQSELVPSDISSWTRQATPTTPMRWPKGETTTTMTGSYFNINTSNAILSGQRLVSLMAEMQDRLQQLEQGPWHTDTAHGLGDYPVGTIIELSKQFSQVASSISSGSSTHANVNGLITPCEEEPSSGPADTPTILLVLCGYTWLVRIYSVALGHFQTHLNCMPTTASAVGPTAVMRLSELAYGHSGLNLQQIHTALCMLLDALHDVECRLGYSAAEASDIAVTLLLSASRRQDGISGGLSRQVTAVKELLREKMRL